MRKLLSLLTLATLGAGCGDVSRLELNLRFPDADTAAATHQLLFVVRQPPKDWDGCAALWAPPGENLAEFDRVVDYPNRTDVVAAPLDVGTYNVFVYSYGDRISAYTDTKGDTVVFCSSDDQCKTSTGGKKCRPVGVLDSAGGNRMACVDSDAGLVPMVAGCAGGVIDATGATELRIDLKTKPAS